MVWKPFIDIRRGRLALWKLNYILKGQDNTHNIYAGECANIMPLPFVTPVRVAKILEALVIHSSGIRLRWQGVSCTLVGQNLLALKELVDLVSRISLI